MKASVFGGFTKRKSTLIPAVNNQIMADGYSLFGLFIGMIVFKGILQSMAGPIPTTICSACWLRARPERLAP